MGDVGMEAMPFAGALARLRERRLAAAIGIAIAGAATLAAFPSRPLLATTLQEGHPAGTGTVRTVTNCSDGDKGSLRDIIQNVALSGDLVDLRQLPALCGSVDSTITLTSGEIIVPQRDLTLAGPEPGTGTVTISGNGTSRVLNGAAPYNPVGTLTITDLSFVDGYHSEVPYAAGGCIHTYAYAVLDRVSISNCMAVSSTGSAFGGGIYAGIVDLTDSTISGNAVLAAELAFGGGAAAGTVEGKYSSISGNSAASDAGTSYGGGAGVFSAFLHHVTIDANEAEYGSALNSRGYKPVVIQDSTISGNTGGSAIRAVSPDDPIGTVVNYLRIANTTIAFNHSTREGSLGAVYFAKGPTDPSSSVTLESSIIAENTAGPANAPADLYIKTDSALFGHDNLVIASNVSPPGVITVTADPLLGPLQDNGGPTLTHALLTGSPAIGAGNVNYTSPYSSNEYDQRGPGFPRSRLVGNVIVTDIGAVQFDTIFANGFD
jgi:hypothetical protein